MSLEATLASDLKTAMLARDERMVSVLKLVKSNLLYAKVAAGTRDEPMDDAAVVQILSKEAKKRQESADLYQQGGNSDKAEAELAEKAIIERYLPARLSEAELQQLIDEVLAANPSPQMGQIIGLVKQKAGVTADGADIARLVKARLNA